MKTDFPLCKEIPYVEPGLRFAALNQQNAVWLDSSALDTKFSRYSYIGFEPIEVLSLKDGLLNNEVLKVNPDDYLRAVLNQGYLAKLPDRPPFQGGLAGFFSYDFGRYFEDLPQQAEDDLAFEDFYLGVFDLVLAFDHQTQRSWLFASGDYRLECEARLSDASLRLADALKMLSQAEPAAHAVPQIGPIESTHTAATYADMVQKTIDYIYDGDIFEANVTQRFKTTFSGSPVDLYMHLRQVNPAPFAAFCNFEHTQLLSSSPERFLKLEDNLVEARPIKGTRRRSQDAAEDKILADDLMQSEKDRAENIMIVDLMRNDLSRVCRPHSIKVPMLCGLESFKTVHHLVSTVHGKLKSGEDAASLLRATFPGGSITGAPKIRAMEIIDELEPYRRGPYCGAIGYLAFNGDMDLNIVIRTMCLKQGALTFGAGGAITADSNPDEEFAESNAKATALHKCLQELG